MRYPLICAAGVVAAIAATTTIGADSRAPVQGTGWILGKDAATLKNPLKPEPATLATGKAIFKDKCQRCHGPGGLGDGPDADPDVTEGMDLTDPKRVKVNADGVMYYKVLNGRKRPKMPSFKEELTEQQIWSVITYTQSLRKKP